MSVVHIDRFSAGLNDLTIKDQANVEAVLNVLRRTKRFSCFEASANQTIARTMKRIWANRVVTDDKSQYPWLNIISIDGEIL